MTTVDVRSILATKRDGGTPDPEQIDALHDGLRREGEVPDYQASALLMAIFVHGMEPAELGHWTKAMLESGRAMDFSSDPGPKVGQALDRGQSATRSRSRSRPRWRPAASRCR